jgi:hypothetical protein
MGTHPHQPARDSHHGKSPIAAPQAFDFRKHGHAMVEWIADYLEGIERHPVQSTVEPGWVRSPCTAFGDANCDTECVNETKPLANSVWRSGCEWGCEAGYAPVWTDYIMYTSAECVAEGSSWWF